MFFKFFSKKFREYQGQIQRFWTGVVPYVGHHGWSTKKILGFRCSKRAKITSETINFGQNISISIFKFSPSLYTMKSCQWNLSISQNFDKERESTDAAVNKKRKLRKVGLCFTTSCFIKTFNMIINQFFVLQAHLQPSFCFLISGWRKKYQKGK